MTQPEIRARVAELRLARLGRLLRPFARLAGVFAKPVTVESFLTERGLSGGVLRSVWGTFGKRVKALYTETRGRAPKTMWQAIVSPSSGKERAVEVAVYRQADLPILWSVWSAHYAV
jgi:uncharacterized protein with HEPN domain